MPKVRTPVLSRIGMFWSFLAIMALCATLFSWLFIARAIQDEQEAVLDTLEGRAASLIWSIEGAMRLDQDYSLRRLSRLLGELGLQPGVMWIAVVGKDGHILADSSASLQGSLFYTPGELASLQPDSRIQGRFSPDDPACYETWKLFEPERLARNKRGFGQAYIFIGLEAAWIGPYVRELRQALIFRAFTIWFAALCGVALLFYVYNFRRSSRQLANIEVLTSQIIDNFPGALLATDLQDRIIFYNQNARQLFQLPKNSLQDLTCYDWRAITDELDKGLRIIEKDAQLSLGDHTALPVSISAVSLQDSAGQVTGRLYILRNLEEIQILKDQLAQSEKLAGIAHLAAGMAHEIRNPLSSIKGYTNFLAQRIPEDTMAQSTAELLIEETDRINRVLSDVLALARTPELKKLPQPLQPLLERAIRLTRPDAETQGIILEHREVNPDIILNVDGDKLLQCLLNILLNAIQATPSGGRVELEVIAPTDANPVCQLIISDNGTGMSEKIRQQIFTPYFTTKVSGSGLGLPITRQIIESHGGVLRVQSTPGHGSSFSIILPVEKK